jgi:hypothetical protein
MTPRAMTGQTLTGNTYCLPTNQADDINIGGWSIKDSATNTFIFSDYLFKSGRLSVFLQETEKTAAESFISTA